ncbi:cache domain-containing sensor histidine kinase [Paenibacillus woosongensis]|uniref:HAMP domain-containing protein n=1 Tax=Paenibacillus woosongensis TaxID=307580 RepID=A0ABQ4MV84_9BACL|nr:sensor histidine kinase [Paenibacillus woosongensis]GIP59837.1 hypothetical protein J15TS10_36510 [Paenibacillus woosongensis]
MSCQSLKRILNRLSIKYKLFILLIFITIIPMAIVSQSSEYFIFQTSTQYSSSISKQYVNYASNEITSYLDNLEEAFDSLYTNNDFQKFLSVRPDLLSEQAEYIMNFRPIIQNSLKFHPEVLGVLYLDKMGKVYFDSYQTQLDSQFNLYEHPVYRSILNTETTQLSEPHLLDYVLYPNDTVFSFIRPIININSGTIESWIILEIQADKILNLLNYTDYEQAGQLILYHPHTQNMVTNNPLDTNLAQDLWTNLHNKGEQQFVFESNNAEYEATYTQLPNQDWMLVWIAPLSSIKQAVTKSYYLTILIGSASLAIALSIGFSILNGILRPLYFLKKGMQSLGRGQYVPIKLKERHDEIGFLIHSYNQMLEKLNKMEQEVYHSKLKEKERELLQLQAQINPHFLYNTLEAIDSYATRNNGEAIEDMIQAVSKMMRYSIRKDGGWAPLQEEISYIQHFLTIHYYRNGQKVNTSFNIDPLAMNQIVMKQIIQPFVENSLKYGWNPNMSSAEFKLSLTVKVIDNGLHITISDTGTGMSKDVLEPVQALLQSKGKHIDAFFNIHTGILNVYRRFILAYGEDAYFQIESARGKGTKVEFHIPLKEN